MHLQKCLTFGVHIRTGGGINCYFLRKNADGKKLLERMEKENHIPLYILEQCSNIKVIYQNKVWEKIKESASAVIRQVEQAGTVFKFTPVLAAAVRGNRETNPEIFRAEDVDDEKTFIVFDAGKRELMIQINRAKLEAERVRVYLCFDNSETIEVSLEEKGKYLRGVLRDISDQDFQIRVERL